MGKPKSTEALKGQAVVLLVEGASYAEIATQIGRSERTVARWMKSDPRFAEAIQRKANAARAAARKAEQRAPEGAIATLYDRKLFYTQIMRDTKQETKDRIKAAETLGKVEGDFVKRVELGITPPASREEALERLAALQAKISGGER